MSAIVLQPLTRDGANELITRWHRHHKPVRSHRFAIGALLEQQLVGAVIVGNPIAAELQKSPIITFEVLRLVTDRAPHVASRLLGASWRSARAQGVLRMVSYTRVDELGTCYRAAGWRPVARVTGRDWTTGNKADRWLPGLYRPSTEVVDRIRWEIAVRGCEAPALDVARWPELQDLQRAARGAAA
jgi:hypothetical protein